VFSDSLSFACTLGFACTLTRETPWVFGRSRNGERWWFGNWALAAGNEWLRTGCQKDVWFWQLWFGNCAFASGWERVVEGCSMLLQVG